MLLFLDLAYEKWREEGRLKTLEDLREAIRYGAVKRLRPKVMTVATNLGLIPLLFSTGSGADVMQRIAAPVIGGLLTSLILVLIVFPVIYLIWKGREFKI
jgi:Cu(I)/Ag(I) efflux system membrane protein CusA/SilA